MTKLFQQICGQYFTLLTLLPLVHLQQMIGHNNNSTVCYTEPSAAKSIFEFWHESSIGCEFDTNNLVQIRKKIFRNLKIHNNDKITELLSEHISSSLKELLFRQITATISIKSKQSKNPALDKILNDLYKEDKAFILNIWQQALDETALFINVRSIIQQILLITENNELKLDLLLFLLNKYEEVQYQNDQRLMALFAYGIASVEKDILKQNKTPYETLLEALKKIPQALLTLYQSWSYNITLFNRQYNDYIYAERDLGPSPNKRYLFTFMPYQNKFKFKGIFKVEFDSEGRLAFGTYYRPSYQYIAAEDHAAFICLNGLAAGEAQWWQALWPLENEEFILLQNMATQELLCATGQYNDKLVLIAMLAEDKHRNNPACQWKAAKKIKNH